MLLYSTIRRHICLTLVALSLCQAFVTSSHFGIRPFLRGGAATPLSSSEKKKETVGPLGVLRAPPSTTRRSRSGGDEDGDSYKKNGNSDTARYNGVKTASASNNGSKNIVRVPSKSLYANGNGENSATAQATAAFRSKKVEYVAETKLPTDVGAFQLRGYRIPGAPLGQEPCVIYCRDKPPFGKDGAPASGVPVRIHDQCLTSEVFRSQRYVFSGNKGSRGAVIY